MRRAPCSTIGPRSRPPFTGSSRPDESCRCERWVRRAVMARRRPCSRRLMWRDGAGYGVRAPPSVFVCAYLMGRDGLERIILLASLRESARWEAAVCREPGRGLSIGSSTCAACVCVRESVCLLAGAAAQWDTWAQQPVRAYRAGRRERPRVRAHNGHNMCTSELGDVQFRYRQLA